MSQATPSHSGPVTPAGVVDFISPAEIDVSCRWPLIILFLGAAIWLVIGSAFGLISSIKFHSPRFLADTAWLTYGRVHPAWLNAMLYGVCLQAGLGVGLWLLARLGRALLAQPWLVTIGAAFWNLGLAVGVFGILAGDTTGFENLEIPPYGAAILFPGYLMIGLWGALTFHQRRERSLFVSQWFLLAALFWFPWIYSTAQLLLVAFPVRGVAQSVIAWWYSDNFLVVWLGLVGLGTVFYFVPKLANRDLHSRYLALLAFWGLVLCGSWCGIPATAPVPAWMPTLSTIATVLMIVPILAAGLNVGRTAVPGLPDASARLSWPFICFGVGAFVFAGLAKALAVLPGINDIIGFTWMAAAQTQLDFYGFFTLVMFGAIYYIAPRLTGIDFPSVTLVRLHFWLAALGTILVVVPLALGGIFEGISLRDPRLAFLGIAKSTLPFLRASTTGDLLIALGHLLFLANLGGLVLRFCRLRAVSACVSITADLTTAEVRS